MYYYIEHIKNNFYHAGNKARKDCDKILKKLGLKKIEIDYYIILPIKTLSRIINLILSIFFNFYNIFFLKREIFCQYPFEKRMICLFYLNKKNRMITIIHDLDSLRSENKRLFNKEIKYLKKSKYIISHNSKMSEILIKNGIDKNKIKNLNIFDYILNENSREINKIKTSDICFAGNLEKSLFIYKLKKLKNIKTDVFGINYQKEKNQGDFNYCGAFPPDEIHKKLSGKYGLVWDGDSLEECNGVFGEYLKYNNPHKFSLYIAAGIPVITWKKAAIAEFIERKNIGITVNSLEELEKILINLSEKEYEEKLKNVLKIREKIINGEILGNIIKEILNEERNE